MDKKWNLQDIKPTERRRPPARTASRPAERASESVRPSEADSPRRVSPRKSDRSGSKKGVVIGAVAVLALALGGIVFSAFTSKTTVTVFPRWREPTVNAVFEAKRQASGSELAYEIMTLEAEGDREVTATGQEEVEEQATGQLTIFKTTTGSERLIKNTRFEAPNGLMYRISESVVVPGSSETGPGSVTAEVFADQSGPEYNLAAGQRFTVPGFRENDLTDLYNAIYAENPAAMTGGHKGPKFIINDDELAAATESLRRELQEALANRVSAEKPAGFAAFDAAIRYDYQALPAEDLGGGKVKIKEKVVLQLPMFKNEEFASFIANATIPGYEGQPIRIEDQAALSFEYATEPNLTAGEPVSFKLLGRPKLIWTYDGEQLKRDLAGGAQTVLNTVLGGYPAIEKATATIKPFWRRSFPDDPQKITVVENLSADQ